MRIGSKKVFNPARRRFLRLAATTGATALCGLRGTVASAQTHIWHGSSLGADATITLGGVSESGASAIFEECLALIARLESQFSLFKENTALVCLNRDGALDNPAPEFVELLDVSRRISKSVGGAFDPTVQPLWQLYVSNYPSADEVTAAKALVDFQNVSWNEQRVVFQRRGMAMTLNGIAQGYITDKIADLLKERGLTSVLINLGEYRAVGAHPDARPWLVGIQDPLAANDLADVVELTNESVATSGGYGARIGGDRDINHLFDPRNGRSADRYLSVSVIHPSATIADGLSTAFSFLSEDEIRDAADAFSGIRTIVARSDGVLVRI
jgi:thiamine biosynthesis lipoprotein